MSGRWYNEKGKNSDIVLVSRIRLLRNFSGHTFPDRASETETASLLALTDEKLQDLSLPLHEPVSEIPVNMLEDFEIKALEERHLINKAAMDSGHNYRLYASDSEDFSLTVNVEDHVRLLVSRRGQCLEELWQKIDEVDNYIDALIPYAYDSKRGFKTSRISSMGTGMRCYYVLHLPVLSEDMSFDELSGEMSRYGVIVKDALNIGTRRVGGLYVIYNQRTLGLSESEIIDILSVVAFRLLERERHARENTDPLILKDRVMRSYGILKYARLLDLTETCRLLSDLMLGESLGYLKTSGSFSLYELMLGVFPGNLQVYYKNLYNENEIKEKRAAYVQHFLNSIKLTD
ncbi:MAG: hypothetical protein IIY77_01085 [Lachnospiraceae bacterium]|nr:hypothetical protein [Lachnospiraceae bacterium]